MTEGLEYKFNQQEATEEKENDLENTRIHVDDDDMEIKRNNVDTMSSDGKMSEKDKNVKKEKNEST
eukprot:CAMPEP_0116901816 /NCGR_PEP_ID=MMETSP0467-20121206/9609_1 /TAXON_ID=283647 /ORGANISM="Mesodinium pulex, Strain SPMC105" /LENGTH=65 /DNA_ID=CAMNT_0004575463 /DNA_START=1866 /DNA_END=2063 /DNA_ORIENTATION=-